MIMHRRIAIAVLFSLLAHVLLLLWVMQQITLHSVKKQGLLQVYLPKDISIQERRSYEGGNAEENSTEKQVTPKKTSQERSAQPGSVHFSWTPPPAYQPTGMMSMMQQAQFAQEREARKNAIMDGMSDASARLRAIVKGNIVCTQHAENGIDCLPVPDGQVRVVLEQFINLILEARRLGIAKDQLHLKFGPASSVSIDLLR